jgi:hypothetical protein
MPLPSSAKMTAYSAALAPRVSRLNSLKSMRAAPRRFRREPGATSLDRAEPPTNKTRVRKVDSERGSHLPLKASGDLK